MKDCTDITLVLDRTGSMESIADDVRGGVSAMIKEQKAEPGEAVFSLIQFDSVDPQEVVIDAQPMQDVPDTISFQPRSMTPLLDALGTAIVRTGERLAAMNEEDRPDKVVIAVYTDGLENASREYTKEKVAELVKRQENDYNWKFLFMGADIDTFGQAYQVGLTSASSVDTSKAKSSQALGLMSAKVAQVRCRGSYEITQQDREGVK